MKNSKQNINNISSEPVHINNDKYTNINNPLSSPVKAKSIESLSTACQSDDSGEELHDSEFSKINPFILDEVYTNNITSKDTLIELMTIADFGYQEEESSKINVTIDNPQEEGHIFYNGKKYYVFASDEDINDITYDLKTIAAYNAENNEVIISIGGTNFAKINDLLDDAKITFGYIPNKFTPLQKFYNIIKEKLSTDFNKDITEVKFTNTGHSLGGLLANIMSVIIADKHNDDIINNIITFDSPGSKEVLENAIKTHNLKANIDKLSKKVIGINNEPNLINTTGTHLGEQYLLVDAYNYSQESDNLIKSINPVIGFCQHSLTSMRKNLYIYGEDALIKTNKWSTSNLFDSVTIDESALTSKQKENLDYIISDENYNDIDDSKVKYFTYKNKNISAGELINSHIDLDDETESFKFFDSLSCDLLGNELFNQNHKKHKQHKKQSKDLSRFINTNKHFKSKKKEEINHISKYKKLDKLINNKFTAKITETETQGWFSGFSNAINKSKNLLNNITNYFFNSKKTADNTTSKIVDGHVDILETEEFGCIVKNNILHDMADNITDSVLYTGGLDQQYHDMIN